ncbi:gliding motility protein GldL [Prevotella sp.]|uniref:type IX secretion system motor protein PorL/GldL n=1 Tax=uncultured Prevotella sp. TaxID=159272 RepID=UPI002583A8BD|nr:gliding motility protein GldL [Prevotella sp.]MDD6853528.1 gliding motility protein GldL [Prevotella sp.]
MAEYSKYNIVYRLQKWMDSVPGQTFLNYAYSWGASIVILGTLFKLTHLPGANIMLFIGMGTEVFVFFISAFDRPFDKTDDGKKIPTRVTEEYLETGKVTYNNIHEDDTEDEGDEQFMTSAPADNSSANVQQSDFGASMSPAASGTASGGSYEPAGPTPGMESPVGGMNPNAAESASAAGQGTAEQALAAAIKQQTEVIASSQTATPEMVDAQEKYVDALKNLTELLGKVGEQSERLTRDSEEMENLNRTLTGISKVYELQLKGASKQVGTIDQINDQTRKMAEQIAKLNEIYTRMIESMTVNMQNKNQ